jgi:hypothetical protein
MSTEAQVLGSMGRPAATFEMGEGVRRLAYPHGPLGTQTFMVDIGRDGHLVRFTQVLDDEVFRRIRPGWTRQEVLQAIGPPGQTMAFARSATDAWDYRYVDTWGYQSIFSVTFDREDRVVSKISQRLERGDKGGNR